jgi:CheY-like chemotaxis protein
MTPPAARTPETARRILVVEDDDALREALAVFLETEGFPPVEASNGAEALRCLRATGAFCLILLDLYMPVMDGWAFRAEQLRDPDLAAIPVIVISADGSVDRNAADLGAVAALRKPVDLDRLRSYVADHC